MRSSRMRTKTPAAAGAATPPRRSGTMRSSRSASVEAGLATLISDPHDRAAPPREPQHDDDGHYERRRGAVVRDGVEGGYAGLNDADDKPADQGQPEGLQAADDSGRERWDDEEGEARGIEGDEIEEQHAGDAG